MSLVITVATVILTDREWRGKIRAQYRADAPWHRSGCRFIARITTINDAANLWLAYGLIPARHGQFTGQT
jgi:hypothetical protein